MFCLAFMLGMPHPPSIFFWSTIYPPGFTWPEIDTLSARAFHASLLAAWAFIYGIPTLIVCGIHQRWYDQCYGIREEPSVERKPPSLTDLLTNPTRQLR
jgi:hypothetical protein